MANWISSKLKVAETLLQQIDQQAAESLKKNDKQRSDELNNDISPKNSEVKPLKDQLKKKTTETRDSVGKLGIDHKLNVTNSHGRDKEVVKAVDSKASASNLTDHDWTKLLSGSSSSPPATRSNGASGIRGLRKDGRRLGRSGSNLSATEAKRGHKTQNSVPKTSPKSGVVAGNDVKSDDLGGRRSHEGDPKFLNSARKTSSADFQTDRMDFEERQLDEKGESVSPLLEEKVEENKGSNGASNNVGDGEQLQFGDHPEVAARVSSDKNQLLEVIPATVNGESDLKMEVNDVPNRYSDVRGTNKYSPGPGRSVSLKRVSSSASGSSDSSSTSDSESEGEREERRRRRAQILAEKAAAKAIEAIKERENMVARLEGEKQSLEKILEERAKQQALEASELQTTTMNMMEAVEVEKQKHNNTRMEALTRLAKLETANADLARSLATAQWNLEVAVNKVSELRQQIELKEASHEEIRRKIDDTHQTAKKSVASKGLEFECEILEAELSLVTDKIGQLQEKANMLEMNIKMTKKDLENPTEVEVELKRRLDQLTDHLIQKQAQVEALSSEKATLLFRIEAVSRSLDDKSAMMNASGFPSTSSRDDLESGKWDLSNSKLGPMLEERIRSGRRHLGSVVRQLDSIFCAGAVFLRRNSTARFCSFAYIICLHIWVMYILMSHPLATEEASSGAVISLENINNTGAV